MKKAATVLAILLLASLAASTEVDSRDVDITAPDGATLKATYYAAGKPGPGILLLHQCNMDRKSYHNLAERLAGSGFHVLTLDYRGYGESAGEQTRAARREYRGTKWPGDVDAAFRFLTSQPGVDNERLGAGGASCGVNQAIQLARRHPEVKALVLLSGRTNEAGMTFIKNASRLSLFGAASEEDTRSARAIRDILALSENRHNELKIFNDAGHGVPMFAKIKTLEANIVAWLKARLR